jgi:hypothetical protein
MVTKESLQEQYKNFETPGLLEIVSPNSGYTELAVAVARDELKYRNVPMNVIKNYRPVLTAVDPLVLQNYLVDLPVFVKIVSFVLWFPRVRRVYVRDFTDGGYVLKNNQSTYYSFVGFLFCVASLVSLNYIPLGYLIWPAGFIPAYLFDISYNRERQERRLQQKVSEGNDPWDMFG